MAYHAVGGYESIKAELSPEMLSLKNIKAVQIINWAFTIIPIWFIGMTLYQRIYASRDEKTAKKAWYIAGLFEWPVMAFLGVSLGLLAKVAAQQGMFLHLGFGPADMPDPEIGLPMLLSNILPAGLLGLMMAAYFSAILSTADSCLMAASGNFTTDLLPASVNANPKRMLRASQITTLLLGILALAIALYLESVLELMLLSYAFMVSGLLVPLVAGLFFKQSSAFASIVSMITGGGLTLFLTLMNYDLVYGFDPIIFGLTASLISFIILKKIKFKYL
jgi:SSS family solute:Na+ symporter